MHRWSSLFVVFCVAQCKHWHHKYPFQDPALPFEIRTDDLVSRLTLDEIYPQTVDNGGGGTPAISRLGIQPYEWSTECIRGQVGTNTTAFPHSIGLAATWNYNLIYNMSEAISFEVRAHWNANKAQKTYISGQGLTCFSPVINIARHPLWGRNEETYGEDPHLSGRLSQAFVRGLQGHDERYLRVGAGCKHFDVHGGPENIPVSRFPFDSMVSIRDWRMTFLPAFKMCVEAGSTSLMCSYNSIRGVPACANKELLTDILRDEWDFQGYIVSDAGAIVNIRTQHNYTKNDVDTATVAIKAGTNLELGGEGIFLNQKKAYQQGNLTEDEIRRNVWPLFHTRMRLGEFDPPEMVFYNRINMTEIQRDTHRELALKAAQQSFVLLKNEKLLPLKMMHYSQISIVGPMANNTEQLYGDYASNVMPQFASNPLQGLSPLAAKVSYASGCADTKCQNYNSSSIQSAVPGSDLVIVCLGTGQAVEAEGNDRADLNLPGKQLDLLQDAAHYAGKTPVLLLLFNAGPLDVTWAQLHPSVSAIMACSFPAQSTGKALYNVLTANGPDSVPAGRLPMTWPASMAQVPDIRNYTMEGRTYRYFRGTPLYPFGYGLSYTTFQYSDLTLSSTEIRRDGGFFMKVMVKNTGSYSADEVVQAYVSWPSDVSHMTPRWQLVDFDRTMIMAGETKAVMFWIEYRRLEVYDWFGWLVPRGMYNLYVGGQQPDQRMTTSSNVLHTTFTVV